MLASILVLAGAAFLLLPRRHRVVLRRGLFRVVGEAAALALRVHDPWARQEGAPAGGLPGRDFLSAPPPETASIACLDARGDSVVVRVTSWSSATTPDAPPFEFERWDDPGLADLRRTYHLERLVRRERPDFPSLLAASAWVAERWRPGGNSPPSATHFDAREVLRRVAKGEVFDCGTYAWTLVQVLAAVGINGRVVELERADGWGHSVVEAWCDDLGKWIVLDPYTNITYMSHGVPLNALELHRLWRAHQASEIQVVSPSLGAQPIGRSRAIADEQLAYYEHFNVRMRNNLRSSSYPRWHPKANRIMAGYEWAGDAPGRPFFRHQIRDSSKLYFSLKSTALRWRWQAPDSTGATSLDLRLATCTANFDTFLFSRDGRHWSITGSSVRISPRASRDTLRFVSRNRGGRIGRPAWVVLETAPIPGPNAASSRPVTASGGRF